MLLKAAEVRFMSPRPKWSAMTEKPSLLLRNSEKNLKKEGSNMGGMAGGKAEGKREGGREGASKNAHRLRTR